VTGSQSRAMHIVFRYDDFSADQDGVRESNALRKQVWEAEQKMDSLFEKYDMSYVTAIIPHANSEYGGVASGGGMVSFSEDREKVEFIKHAVQAGRIEVAQHGFSHTNIAGSYHRPGEFRGGDYESQHRDIVLGREALLTACNLSEINTFVPPWNGWDENTAFALKQAGFTILSADRYYYFDSARGLNLIPFTAVPGELELMVHEGRLPKEDLIVVLYHPFEITEFSGTPGDSYYGIERFEKLFRKLTEISEIEVGTFVDLVNKSNTLTVERYQQAQGLWRQQSFWARLLPRHFWPGIKKQEVYLGRDEYSQTKNCWVFATAGFIVGFLVLGLLSRHLLGLVLPAKWYLVTDVVMTLLFCVSLISELRLVQRGYHMSGIRGIPLFFGGGFVIGLILRVFN